MFLVYSPDSYLDLFIENTKKIKSSICELHINSTNEWNMGLEILNVTELNWMINFGGHFMNKYQMHTLVIKTEQRIGGS